jgi:hypothetical protein
MIEDSHYFQWDFKTYYYAAKAYNNSLNPYSVKIASKIAQEEIHHIFSYPPYTLIFFSPFAYFDYSTSYQIFLFIKISCVIFLLFIWKKILYLNNDILFYFFCMLAFNSGIMKSITTGNVSLFEQLSLWIALYYYLDKKHVLFCIFIMFSAWYKIILFVFIGLLLFQKKGLKYIVTTSFIMLVLHLLSLYYTPDLYLRFINIALGTTSESGVTNPVTVYLIKDLLNIIFTVIYKNSVDNGIWFPLILLSYTVIIFTSYQAFKAIDIYPPSSKKYIQLFFLCTLYAILTPRLKDYSYFFMIPSTYYIICNSRHITPYPFLFLCLIYSVKNLDLPGPNMAFHAVPVLDMNIRAIIINYHTLLLSYMIWSIYIYEIFSEAMIYKNKKNNRLYIFNLTENCKQMKEKVIQPKENQSKINIKKVSLNFLFVFIILSCIFLISNYLINLSSHTLDLGLTGKETGLPGIYSKIITKKSGNIITEPVFKRLDNEINFDWSDHPPKRSFPSHDYMINWEGLIKIDQKGIYHFITQSDDGVRFWIDQQMLIDDWKIHGVEENIASIELTPGWHSIRLDYLQKGGNAVIRLLWEPPGNPRQIIPEAYFRPDVSKTTSQQNE